MAFTLLLAMINGNALALDGLNLLELSTDNGWSAFELVTQGDNISAITDSNTDYGTTASRGTYDGLGSYLSGNTLSIFVNHEVTDNGAISRLDLDLPSFQQAIASTIDGGTTAFPSSIATGMGYGYNTIYDGTYHAVNNSGPAASGTSGVAAYGSANFSRFCSGTSYLADGFGAGRGFVDQIYMTGEETSGGQFFALDSATKTLWEVPDVGMARWENAALVDTGNTTQVAMVLSSDNGTSPGDYLRLYVGTKGLDINSDGEVDFLERNGLRGGTVYHFVPDSGSTTDLPDGPVTGTWSTSTTGALQETKLEDIHTNPLDGAQLVFADQNDGVYTMDLNLQFSGGLLDTALSTIAIDQINDDDSLPISAPDNLTWTMNNLLFVQEDGDGDGDGNGDDIWQMNPDGTGILRIAHGFSEPSGIFDVSSLVGYQPGSILLTSLQGGGGADAQLSVLVSPSAAVVPEPATVSLATVALLMILLVTLQRARSRMANQ